MSGPRDSPGDRPHAPESSDTADSRQETHEIPGRIAGTFRQRASKLPAEIRGIASRSVANHEQADIKLRLGMQQIMVRNTAGEGEVVYQLECDKERPRISPRSHRGLRANREGKRSPIAEETNPK
jgi:hypothetical protein